MVYAFTNNTSGHSLTENIFNSLSAKGPKGKTESLVRLCFRNDLRALRNGMALKPEMGVRKSSLRILKLGHSPISTLGDSVKYIHTFHKAKSNIRL